MMTSRLYSRRPSHATGPNRSAIHRRELAADIIVALSPYGRRPQSRAADAHWTSVASQRHHECYERYGGDSHGDEQEPPGPGLGGRRVRKEAAQVPDQNAHGEHDQAGSQTRLED